MRTGKILAVAMIGFAVVAGASVAMSFEQEPDTTAADIENAQSRFEIYDKKKMYPEAINSYKVILEKAPYNYDYFDQYVNYCNEHEFQSESYRICREKTDALAYSQKLAAKNGEEIPAKLFGDDVKPFKQVIEYLYSTGSREIFNVLYDYMATFNDTAYPEVNKYLTDFYYQIRGDVIDQRGGYQSAGQWNGSYSLGVTEKGVYAVIGDTGSALGTNPLGEIVSYSPEDQLIATIHEGQLVYVNFTGERKRVPFDTEKMELLEYKYLGSFSGGIANYCSTDGNWGYLRYDPASDSIYSIMDNEQQTAPWCSGAGAYIKDGKWRFLVNNGGSLETVGEYADIYLDSNGNALSVVTVPNSDNTGTVNVWTAFVKKAENDGWTPVRIGFDADGAVYVSDIGSAQYQEVRPFHEYAAVSGTDGKWSLIDINGETVFTCDYDELGGYGSGFVSFKKGSRWGYTTLDGKTVIEPRYDGATAFNDKGTAIVNDSGAWKAVRLAEYVYKEEA